MLERGAQAAMVFVLERHKAERLQNTVECLAHWAEDFGHAVHRPGLGLKRDFYEVALPQRLGQIQQASGCRDGLEFCFCATAIFKPNRSQNGIA